MANPPPGSGPAISRRKPGGTLTQRERNPGGGYDLFEDQPVTEIFADGLHQSVLTGQIARLYFFRSEGFANDTPPIDQRRLVASLVIPLPALLHMFGFIAQQIQANQTPLLTAIDDTRKLVAGLSQENMARLQTMLQDQDKQ